MTLYYIKLIKPSILMSQLSSPQAIVA
uniref:Uncharacterized protein n=1 Tax=Arundo donax TaxID=35708 RepID=A0A0A9A359_ARUDO